MLCATKQPAGGEHAHSGHAVAGGRQGYPDDQKSSRREGVIPGRLADPPQDLARNGKGKQNIPGIPRVPDEHKRHLGDQRPAPQAVQLRLAYFRVPCQIHSPCQTEQRKTTTSQQAHHFIVSGQQ